MIKWIQVLIVLVWAFGCSTANQSNKDQSVDEKTLTSNPLALSREGALMRSKQLSKVSYQLWFGLDPNQSNFLARTVIHFDLKPKAKEVSKKLFIDLEGGNIRSLKINGSAVTDFSSPERFDGHHIFLNVSELQANANRVEIAYSHPYSKDGYGLHSFKDPVDQETYLYSNFEPYHAHKLFPCFDQPDIKASYELTVEAPPEWEVISNTLPREVSPMDGRKSWIFPPSPIFSTYVFALHAGPYSVWKANANGIPTRLFARKSLSKFVDHKEWLKITEQGLDFFGVQFGTHYPFEKYDQIIVPDFNAGAMENVGAVTFSERYIYRTQATQDRHRRRAETILHEMAHMWFGDLVTMKWWNGLWLNESFATIMASWAVDQATDFKGSWHAFFSGIKEWAYWEDQLITSHPIELPVPDTDHAEANFDGITYGKGASSLKQLKFYLGEDDFREGLQRYFQKYSYKNTTLNDFIKMLAEASSKDLTQWQQTWFQTTGVNTIRAEWECETSSEQTESKIKKFDLIQLPANISGELRPHRTKIALFHFPKGKSKSKSTLIADKPVEMSYSGSKTSVVELIGKSCPNFVFPNYEDFDYARVELDSESLNTAFKNLAKFSDPLTRQMIWHSLWEMVVDAKILPQAFADTVMTQADQETNTLILSKVLSRLVRTSLQQNSILKFLKGESRTQYHQKVENWIHQHLLSAQPKSDLQITWFKAYLEAAHSPKAVEFLRNLLHGKKKLRGFEMDQERRWDVIQALARNNDSGIKEVIDVELKKDPTDMGQKAAISAEASIPNSEIKSQWLKQLNRETGTLPLAKLREAMPSFYQLGNEDLTKAAVQSYFETVPKLAQSTDPQVIEYSKWYTGGMYPALCSKSIVELTDKLLSQYPNLPTSVTKDLKIGKQEEERCIRARALSDASP